MSRFHRLTQNLLMLSFSLILATLSGCGGSSDSASNSGSTSRSVASVQIPVRLKASALPNDGGTGLHGYVRIDGGNRQEMTISGGQASFSIADLNVGNHTVTIEFEHNSALRGTVPIASYQTTVNINEGGNSLPPVTENDYSWPDADGDGRNNYEELVHGSDPAVAEYAIGGTVTGLAGDVTLALNTSHPLTVSPTSSKYEFETWLASGASYAIAITSTPPVGQQCRVDNALGTVASAAVTNVNLICGDPAPVIQSLSQVYASPSEELKVSGNNLKHASVTLNQETITATSITTQTDHSVIFIVPADLSAGSVTLSLTNSNGADSHLVNVGERLTATDVKPGASHACALQSNGKIKCWGANSYGQLGNGTNTDSNTAVTVSMITNATAIATANNHSCAISSGQVKCWGANSFGQLGNATTTDSNTPVPVTGISNAIAIATANNSSCALLGTGTVRCWGRNGFGQLGDTTTTNSSIPVTVSGITAIRIAASGEHTCALTNSGGISCWGYLDFIADPGSKSTPVTLSGFTSPTEISTGYANVCALSGGSIKCLGNNDNGQLGNGTFNTSTTPVPVSGITTATQITGGMKHSCAKLSNGSAACWGAHDNGLLGNNVTTDSNVPVSVNSALSPSSISAGLSNTCVVRSTDNTIYCWGLNDHGQTGNGIPVTPLAFAPVTISDIETATNVSVGSDHACAVITANTIQCWGQGQSGQLGNGANDSKVSPVAVTGIINANAVSSGYQYSCATTNGSVQCWGINDHGQLGDGTTANKNSPVSLNPTVAALAISSGERHACATLNDGSATTGHSVQCWGYNGYGQLGDGSTQDNHSAENVLTSGGPALAGAMKVSAGSGHTCAQLHYAFASINGVQTSYGPVQCWGSNSYGQLGNSTTSTPINHPVEVFNVSNAIDVSAGVYHSCAALKNGDVKCWGRNNVGQLGDNSTTDSNAPLSPISGISSAAQVSIGTYHSCARLQSGQVKCWGNNQDGQLGDDTNVDKHYPSTTVKGIENAVWISVSSSANRGCAVLADGYVQCWGNQADPYLLNLVRPVLLTPQ